MHFFSVSVFNTFALLWARCRCTTAALWALGVISLGATVLQNMVVWHAKQPRNGKRFRFLCSRRRQNRSSPVSSPQTHTLRPANSIPTHFSPRTPTLHGLSFDKNNIQWLKINKKRKVAWRITVHRLSRKSWGERKREGGEGGKERKTVQDFGSTFFRVPVSVVSKYIGLCSVVWWWWWWYRITRDERIHNEVNTHNLWIDCYAFHMARNGIPARKFCTTRNLIHSLLVSPSSSVLGNNGYYVYTFAIVSALPTNDLTPCIAYYLHITFYFRIYSASRII